MKCGNKRIAFILCMILCIGVLGACGNNSATGNAGTDTSEATEISFSDTTASISGNGAEADRGIVTITDGGVYIISGNGTDGRIIVNAPDKEVTLVFENLALECSYGSPIYIYKSKSTTIYLSEGTTNTLTDSSEYTFDDSFSSAVDEEPNACLYSKSDLVIAGKGQLVVHANYKNGITGKDTLTIDESCITVNAVNHGIHGKDFCVINNSDIKIEAGGDAVRSTNDSDSTLGYIEIADSALELNAAEDGIQAVTALTIRGGTYHITAGDDGIHSDGNTSIMDGTINIIDCYEGIEGQTVDISGGVINIVARDDGINAAGGNNQDGFGFPQGRNTGTLDCYINISGGIITMDASGDGVDSNGNLTVSGGELYVSGPLDNGNSALDYDGEATITGGIVVAAGSSKMAQNFGNNSTQGSILLTYSEYSDERITLKDASGNTLVSYSPAKNYNCVVISCPSIKTGNTYTVEACGENASVTMDSLIYGNPGGMQGGPFGGGNPGDMQGGPFGGGEPGNMEKPDGEKP